MGTIIRCFFTIIVLNATIPAYCYPFQQSPDTIQQETFAKGSGPVNTTAVLGSSTSLKVDTNVVAERDTSFMQINTKLKAAIVRLKQKTVQAVEFVKQNNFNTQYCFLVDMSIPSGKKRFFVYNMVKDSVEVSSLVSHGVGSWTPNCDDKLIFSNAPNSFATSLGKYKIGASYYGTYGLSYKLYGLDSTNNKAFERAIVLHSDSYVPDQEAYPRHIYQSAGCPIVSPSVLGILGKYITTSSKPVLLWIYN